MNIPDKAEHEEAFYAGQTRVLEMVATGAALSDTLTSIVRLLETQAEGMICSILLLDPSGKNVQHGAAPSLPEAYIKEIDGAPIGPRNGSCGTAMFLKQPVVVTDVMTDPLWVDYRVHAARFGLRACWSTPIFSSQGDVLGSFAMYGQERRGPNANEKHLIAVATHITGIAIERKHAEDAVREGEARIRLAAESGDVAFWSYYPAQNTVWMNEKGRGIYGFDATQSLTRELLLAQVHPDDNAAAKEIFDSVCLSHLDFDTEHRLLSRYGKVRSVIMRGRCLHDENGGLAEVTGVTIDIST
ncbi:MAG TPA: GAF domain-containing protein, partial [Chthoniobacterales bacterium]|nr:GAF domain-containing protein [Chthoniobacterales bacterium]